MSEQSKQAGPALQRRIKARVEAEQAAELLRATAKDQSVDTVRFWEVLLNEIQQDVRASVGKTNMGRPAVVPMTDEEARKFEQSQTVPYGMQKDYLIADCRPDLLDYYVAEWENQFEFHVKLAAYLKNPGVRRMIEELGD